MALKDSKWGRFFTDMGTTFVKEQTKDYFENVNLLRQDARNTGKLLGDTFKTGKEKLDDARKSFGRKAILDWFGIKVSETTPDSEDEYDAGMTKTGDDEDQQSTSKELDADKMASISKEQRNTMYEVAEQQTKVAIANSADQISTINSRSSEILTSVNNIGTKLDKIIDMMQKGEYRLGTSVGGSGSVSGERQQTGSAVENGLFDKNGNVTLAGLLAATPNALTNIQNETFQQMLSFGQMFNMFRKGEKRTAGEFVGGLANLVVDALNLKDRQIQTKNGPKSINQIGTEFNEMVGSVSQNVLQGILKLDIFKSARRFKGDTDYGAIDKSQFSKDAAIFDKQTRHTIISVIPEYLKSINKALTGRTLNVDEYGRLTERNMEQAFDAAVVSNASKRANVNLELLNDSRSGNQPVFTSDELQIAEKACMQAIDAWMQDTGEQFMTASDFNDKDIRTNAALFLHYAMNNKISIERAAALTNTFLARCAMDKSFGNRVAAQAAANRKSVHAAGMERVGTLGAREINNTMRQNLLRAEASGNDKYGEENYEVTIGNSTIGGNGYMGTSTQILDTVREIRDILDQGIRVYNTKGSPVRNKPRARSSSSVSKSSATGTASSSTSSSDGDPGGGSESESSSTGGQGIDLGNIAKTAAALAMMPFGPAFLASGLISKVTHTPQATPTGDMNALKNVLGSAAQTVSNTVGGMLPESVTNKVDKSLTRAINNETAKEAAEYRKNADYGDVSREDQIYADNAIKLIETALSDSETESFEVSEINDVIDHIKDKELRGSVKKTADGMLRKRKQSLESGKSSGILGKGLKMLWSGAKTLLKPVFAVIKGTLGGILKGVKKLAPVAGFLGVIVKLLTSGVKDTLTGIKSVVTGFGGAVKNTWQIVSSPFKAIGSGIQSIKDKQALKAGMKARKAYARNAYEAELLSEEEAAAQEREELLASYQSRKDAAYSNSYNAAKQAAEEARQAAREKDKARKKEERSEFWQQQVDNSPVAKTAGKVWNFVKGTNSEFVEGVVEGFTGLTKEQRKEKKEKASLEEAKKQNPVVGGIMDIMNGEKKESLFSRVMSKLESFLGRKEKEDEAAEKEHPTMDSLDEDQKSGSEMPDLDESALNQGETKVGGGGKEPKGIAGLVKNIGKQIGGVGKIMMGIGKIVLDAVMSLSALQTLTTLVGNIIKDGIQPLNAVFKSITSALKPVISIVTESIQQIVGYVVDLADTLIDIVTPIIQMIGPLVQQIMGVITPILDVLTSTVKVILAPIMGVLTASVVPALNIISDGIKVVQGLMNIHMGILMNVGGGLVTAIGWIASIFGNKSMLNTGQTMIKNGQNMITGGIDNVVEGAKGMWNDAKSGITNFVSTAVTTTKDILSDNQEVKTRESSSASFNGSILEGTTAYGNGDYHAQSYYGGRYGMEQHGCGPTALADAYNRRSGRNVDALNMAAMMNGNGTYSTTMGTSVGGFMQASSALGMNLRPGGVTSSSLKLASPHNPITIVGSGSEFGTRPGNVHYMNVVGSSKDGAVYVSNPLSGRIERRNSSSLANSSLMGLYGSGDFNLVFGDSFNDAFNELKELAGKIFTMFSTEKGEDDVATAASKKSKQEAELDSLKKTLGDEKYQEYYDKAYEQFKQDYSNLDITPKKLAEEWENSKYARIMQLASTDTAFQMDQYGANMFKYTDANGNEFDLASSLKETSENFMNESGSDRNMFDVLDSIASNTAAAIAGDSTGLFRSEKGAVMFNPYVNEEPKYKQNQFGATLPSSKGILPEFFSTVTGNQIQLTSAYGGYNRQGINPDGSVSSTTGKVHSGIDLNFAEGTPVFATTGGKVVLLNNYNLNNPTGLGLTGNDSYGNLVVIKDAGGDRHYYAHLKQIADGIQVGSEIQGGQQIGLSGNTGHSTGPHLHYETRKGESGSIRLNPNTFYHWAPGGLGNGVMNGSTNKEKLFSYLVTSGLTKEAAAGVMGNLMSESGCDPNSVEYTYLTYKGMSGQNQKFINMVDNGQISRENFINVDPGFDKRYYSSGNNSGLWGYGLAGFTAAEHKQYLYDKTHPNNLSVGDLGTQAEYLLTSISGGKYNNILDRMNAAGSVEKASDIFLDDYERPYTKNYDTRRKASLAIYNAYKDRADLTQINPDEATYISQDTGEMDLAYNGVDDTSFNADDVYRYFLDGHYYSSNGKYYGTYNGMTYAMDGFDGSNGEQWKTTDAAKAFLNEYLKNNGEVSPTTPISQTLINSGSIAPITGYFTETNLPTLSMSNGEVIASIGSKNVVLKNYRNYSSWKDWCYGNDYDSNTANVTYLNKSFFGSVPTIQPSTKNTNIGSLDALSEARRDKVQQKKEAVENTWVYKLGSFLSGNGDTTIGDGMFNSNIPEIDFNKIDPTTGNNMWAAALNNQSIPQTSVNGNQVGFSDPNITRIMNHTFEVKSSSIEGILNRILTKMDEKRINAKNGTTTIGSGGNISDQMFDDKIPNAVIRLAQG